MSDGNVFSTPADRVRAYFDSRWKPGDKLGRAITVRMVEEAVARGDITKEDGEVYVGLVRFYRRAEYIEALLRASSLAPTAPPKTVASKRRRRG